MRPGYSDHGRARPPQQNVDAEASPVFFQYLFHRMDLKGLVGDDLLEAGIFHFDLAGPLETVDGHAVVLGSPAMVGCLADSHFPTKVADLCPSSTLLSAVTISVSDRRFLPAISSSLGYCTREDSHFIWP